MKIMGSFQPQKSHLVDSEGESGFVSAFKVSFRSTPRVFGFCFQPGSGFVWQIRGVETQHVVHNRFRLPSPVGDGTRGGELETQYVVCTFFLFCRLARPPASPYLYNMLFDSYINSIMPRDSIESTGCQQKSTLAAAKTDRGETPCAFGARCGKPAPLPRRIIDGDPAPYNSPQIHLGGKETYQPRCEECHELPGRPLPALSACFQRRFRKRRADAHSLKDGPHARDVKGACGVDGRRVGRNRNPPLRHHRLSDTICGRGGEEAPDLDGRSRKGCRGGREGFVGCAHARHLLHLPRAGQSHPSDLEDADARLLIRLTLAFDLGHDARIGYDGLRPHPGRR